MKADAILMHGASEIDADIYYRTGFLAPDPFTYLRTESDEFLVVSELEYGRARAESKVPNVIQTKPYFDRAKEEGIEHPKAVHFIDYLLRENGIRSLRVPPEFPLGIAEMLRRMGYRIQVGSDPFVPEREIKSEEEIARIAEAEEATEAAMALAIETIASARIRDGLLYLDGDLLTAERIRAQIHHYLYDRGLLAAGTIVAGGDQACSPHAIGTGPLPAHKAIIIDIFPRSIESRYWGDMTRTVVRGEAPEEIRRMHRTVLTAQEKAIDMIRDDVDAQNIHAAVLEVFAREGYKTEVREGGTSGFFHGTGHGIGLEIHEPPRIARYKAILRSGMVVTVEPGLYYPGIGGVRIEDAVVVTRTGHHNLNRYPKTLEV